MYSNEHHQGQNYLGWQDGRSQQMGMVTQQYDVVDHGRGVNYPHPANSAMPGRSMTATYPCAPINTSSYNYQQTGVYPQHFQYQQQQASNLYTTPQNYQPQHIQQQQTMQQHIPYQPQQGMTQLTHQAQQQGMQILPQQTSFQQSPSAQRASDIHQINQVNTPQSRSDTFQNQIMSLDGAQMTPRGISQSKPPMLQDSPQIAPNDASKIMMQQNIQQMAHGDSPTQIAVAPREIYNKMGAHGAIQAQRETTLMQQQNVPQIMKAAGHQLMDSVDTPKTTMRDTSSRGSSQLSMVSNTEMAHSNNPGNLDRNFTQYSSFNLTSDLPGYSVEGPRPIMSIPNEPLVATSSTTEIMEVSPNTASGANVGALETIFSGQNAFNMNEAVRAEIGALETRFIFSPNMDVESDQQKFILKVKLSKLFLLIECCHYLILQGRERVPDLLIAVPANYPNASPITEKAPLDIGNARSTYSHLNY